MKSALKDTKLECPESWGELPRGSALKQSIEVECDESSRMFFGYHLVKLGHLSAEIELPSCPIKHVVSQTPKAKPLSSVVSTPQELPFVENSVDAFLLANELDFAVDPHQILREVDRAITPNGYVMLTGFNPLSIAGILRFVPHKRIGFLRNARFFTKARVKDWLQLLGFEIIEHRTFAHFSLLSSTNNRLMNRLHRFCSKYFPWSGAMYVIIARKREIPLSVVKPSWRLKPRFSAVGASALSNKTAI